MSEPARGIALARQHQLDNIGMPGDKSQQPFPSLFLLACQHDSNRSRTLYR